MSFVKLPVRSTSSATCHVEIRVGKTVADMKDIVAVRCTPAVPPRRIVILGGRPPFVDASSSTSRTATHAPLTGLIRTDGVLFTCFVIGVLFGCLAVGLSVSARMLDGKTSPSRQAK